MSTEPNQQHPEEQVDPEEVRTRPFAAVLQEVNRGRTMAELSSGLQDLVAAVVDTGQKGTITFVLEVKRAGDMVVLTDKVVVKKPETRAASMFFVDSHLNLVRDNPEQPQLPLTAVTDDTTKSVDLHRI